MFNESGSVVGGGGGGGHGGDMGRGGIFRFDLCVCSEEEKKNSLVLVVTNTEEDTERKNMYSL